MTFLCSIFFFFLYDCFLPWVLQVLISIGSSGLNCNDFQGSWWGGCAHPFHQVLHLLVLKDRVAQSLYCPFSGWSEMISESSFDTSCQMPVHRRRMHMWICSLGCFLALAFSSSLSFMFSPLTESFLVLVIHQLLSYSFSTPSLLCISQPLQSIARPQIPWRGEQENEGI